VSTPRLLAGAGVAIALLAAGDLPAVPPVCCLVALVAVGEIWLRALTPGVMPAAARIGLVVASGLITLPLVAIILHVLAEPIRARSIAAGLAVVAGGAGAVALWRERSGPVPAGARFLRTLVAVTIPLVLALGVAGTATFAYVRLPHPPQPGYTSVALGGWAAGIDRPVAFPAHGLEVPIRVSSAGEPAAVAPLRVRVGDRPAGPPQPVPIAADSTRSVEVYVPAPPDGCLHRIEISLGAASTVFYGRGPAAC